MEYKQRIEESLLNQKWIFAKSMPTVPHEYAVRANWIGEVPFEAAFHFLQTHSYPQNFFKRVFYYYDIGPHQYWTCGEPIEKATVINRALKKKA